MYTSSPFLLLIILLCLIILSRWDSQANPRLFLQCNVNVSRFLLCRSFWVDFFFLPCFFLVFFFMFAVFFFLRISSPPSKTPFGFCFDGEEERSEWFFQREKNSPRVRRHFLYCLAVLTDEISGRLRSTNSAVNSKLQPLWFGCFAYREFRGRLLALRRKRH